MASRPLAAVVRYLHRISGSGGFEAADAELVTAYAAQRDSAAFEAIVRRHGPLVLGVCRRVLGAGPDVDDAFQATFLVLARKAHAIRRRDSVGSWLHGVAYNMAKQLRKKRAIVHGHESPLDSTEPSMPMNTDPAHLASLRELGAVLDEELQRLPAACRAAVISCHLEGASTAEAAHLLGVPATTLKSRLQRGRELLRRRLERRGIGLSTMGLAVLLVEQSRAGITSAVVRATVAAALSFAAAGTASVSSQAAVLAAKALKTTALGKINLVVCAVLTFGFLGLGAAIVPSPAPSVQAVPKKFANPGLPADQKSVAKDFQGDPLPDGAFARLGTVRWNHGGTVTYAAFLPDGKSVFTVGMDGTARVWEYPSGKEIRRIGKLAADFSGNFWRRTGANYFDATVSSDGKHLAIDALPAGSGRIYDFATGQALHQLYKPREFCWAPALFCMAFSPDGRQLAGLFLGGGDIGIWNTATGKLERIIDVPGEGTQDGLAFSPDSTVLATSCVITKSEIGGGGALIERVGGIRLWNPRTGKELRTIITSPGAYLLSAPAFSSDGKQVAVANHLDGTITVVEAGSGKQICKFVEAFPDDLLYGKTSLVFGSAGDKLYSRSWLEPAILEWDMKTTKVARKLSTHSGPHLPVSHSSFPASFSDSMSLSPDGKVLALTQWFHSPEFLDLETGKAIAGARTHAKALLDVRFTADGKYVVTQNADGVIRKWEKSRGNMTSSMPLPKQSHYATISPHAKMAANFVDDSHHVKILDLDSAKELAKFAAPAGGKLADVVFSPDTVVFSPDEKLVAVRWPVEDKIDLFDLTTSKRLQCLAVITGVPKTEAEFIDVIRENRKSAPETMLISPDGKVFAAYVDPKTFAFWDVATGKRRWSLTLPDDAEILGGAFSPDGRSVALDIRDKPVALYEVASGSLRRTFTDTFDGDKRGIEGPAFVSDKKYPILRGKQVTFSPDGKTLAHVGADCAVHLWDVASGKETAVLTGHSGVIRSLAFSPDGKTLASASSDTTVLLWDVNKR